jgi:protein-tyrosine phosphatase
VSRAGFDIAVLPPPQPDAPYRVVFVCTGNICRSPMAEIITRDLAELVTLEDGTTLASHLTVTSAGTGPWHEGGPMDPRTAAALIRADFTDHPHVAHQIATSQLGQYDLVVALDRRHQQTLLSLGTPATRLFLLRSFDPKSGAAADVPDPYYGDEAAFDECLEMIADACRGLVAGLAELWGAPPVS